MTTPTNDDIMKAIRELRARFEDLGQQLGNVAARLPQAQVVTVALVWLSVHSMEEPSATLHLRGEMQPRADAAGEGLETVAKQVCFGLLDAAAVGEGAHFGALTLDVRDHRRALDRYRSCRDLGECPPPTHASTLQRW